MPYQPTDNIDKREVKQGRLRCVWRGGGSETGGMSCMAGQHNITDAFRRVIVT